MKTLTKVKERPILFNGEMVRAILEGRKTMTRRPLSPQPEEWVGGPGVFMIVDGRQVPAPLTPIRSPRGKGKYPVAILCPYGQPGDRLWVRETWAIDQCGSRVSLSAETWPDGWPLKRLRYPATDKAPRQYQRGNGVDEPFWWNKRPSIYMPRWASRILLEITSVKIERIQGITQQGAIAEGYATGIRPFNDADGPPKHRFMKSWNAIYPGSWDSNSWVWVIEFKRIEQQQGEAGK